jgi:hypothetical protein
MNVDPEVLVGDQVAGLRDLAFRSKGLTFDAVARFNYYRRGRGGSPQILQGAPLGAPERARGG